VAVESLLIKILMRTLFASLVCVLIARVAEAAPNKGSAETLSCARANGGDNLLIVEVCETSARENLVRVKSFATTGRLKTEVNALYLKGEPIWDRVWISSGLGRFTAREQTRLSRLAIEAPEVLVKSNTLSFISLLADFLAPETSIENFDSAMMPSASARVWGSNITGTWTPICEFIGQTRLAQYTLPNDPVPHVSLWPVGEPATYCKGRCGWGCAQTIPQHKRSQYTQECFDHDVCYSETGALLGVCKQTFWIAAASYVFAPNCSR
jgi:hypothetical protein